MPTTTVKHETAAMRRGVLRCTDGGRHIVDGPPHVCQVVTQAFVCHMCAWVQLLVSSKQPRSVASTIAMRVLILRERGLLTSFVVQPSAPVLERQLGYYMAL